MMEDEDFVLVAIGAEEENSLLELCVDFARLACNQVTHPLPQGMLFGLRMKQSYCHSMHIVRAGRVGSQSDSCVSCWLPARGLYVLKWDSSTEVFVLLDSKEAPEIAAVQARLTAIGTESAVCEAPVPKKHGKNPVSWEQLTSSVTEKLLTKCGIPPGVPVAASDDDDCGDSRLKDLSGKQMTPFFGGTGAPARVPRYSPLRPERGTTPEVYCAQDVRRLKWILDSGCDVIGELQLAFVHFVVLGCRRSFEHWKTLTDVLAGSVLALGVDEGGSSLSLKFVDTVYAQFSAVDARDIEEGSANISQDSDDRVSGVQEIGTTTSFIMETFGPLLAELHDDESADPTLWKRGYQLAQLLEKATGFPMWVTSSQMEVALLDLGDENAPVVDDQTYVQKKSKRSCQHELNPSIGSLVPEKPSDEHVAKVCGITEALDSADADMEQSELINRRLKIRKHRRGFHYSNGMISKASKKERKEPKSSHPPRQGPLSFSLKEDEDVEEEDEMN